MPLIDHPPPLTTVNLTVPLLRYVNHLSGLIWVCDLVFKREDSRELHEDITERNCKVFNIDVTEDLYKFESVYHWSNVHKLSILREDMTKRTVLKLGKYFGICVKKR